MIFPIELLCKILRYLTNNCSKKCYNNPFVFIETTQKANKKLCIDCVNIKYAYRKGDKCYKHRFSHKKRICCNCGHIGGKCYCV